MAAWHDDLRMDDHTRLKHGEYTGTVENSVSAAILMLAEEVGRAADCLEQVCYHLEKMNDHKEDR